MFRGLVATEADLWALCTSSKGGTFVDRLDALLYGHGWVSQRVFGAWRHNSACFTIGGPSIHLSSSQRTHLLASGTGTPMTIAFFASSRDVARARAAAAAATQSMPGMITRSARTAIPPLVACCLNGRAHLYRSPLPHVRRQCLGGSAARALLDTGCRAGALQTPGLLAVAAAGATARS